MNGFVVERKLHIEICVALVPSCLIFEGVYSLLCTGPCGPAVNINVVSFDA